MVSESWGCLIQQTGIISANWGCLSKLGWFQQAGVVCLSTLGLFQQMDCFTKLGLFVSPNWDGFSKWGCLFQQTGIVTTSWDGFSKLGWFHQTGMFVSANWGSLSKLGCLLSRQAGRRSWSCSPAEPGAVCPSPEPPGLCRAGTRDRQTPDTPSPAGHPLPFPTDLYPNPQNIPSLPCPCLLPLRVPFIISLMVSVIL